MSLYTDFQRRVETVCSSECRLRFMRCPPSGQDGGKTLFAHGPVYGGKVTITGPRLALFLDELGKVAAHPKAVVCDNGPETASKAMRFWSGRSGAAPDFIQPGKPTMSAFVESFNGKFRDSCLNQHWFRGLADVRRIVDD